MVVGTAVSGLAAPRNYQIGSNSSVDAYDDVPSNQGLEIHTSMSGTLAGHNFVLDDGDSEVFDFFRLWTNEGTVNFGEDTLQKTITATLDFDIPDLNAVISGITFAGYITIPVLGNGIGKLQWTGGPVTIDAGDRKFTVSLNDATFNKGTSYFGDLTPNGNGALVQATVTQKCSPTAVPDGGATFPMLGAAVAALGFFSFRSRK
jgi:hypothetical protein